MPQLSWLRAEQKPDFPSTALAMDEPNGLLAVGGSLTVPWLLTAYQRGIFPWFSEDEPIMWWSPAPRMVLQPGSAHIARSLRKAYKRYHIEVRANSCFEQVIHQCSQARSAVNGVWITPAMKQAYIDLHHSGWAHSIEVYFNGELAGGLYGVGIWPVFYGESMFSLSSNASKFAFIALSQWTLENQLALIDCQLYNDYLHSLGAQLISRESFENLLPKQLKPLHLTTGLELTPSLHMAFRS